MEVLQTLSVALGLAALSGYSLYLTVFSTGLAIHLGWVHLAPQFESLSVLGDPGILIVSGLLFALEFLADKIPWVDSVWDAVHTVIRPIGGAIVDLDESYATALGTTERSFAELFAEGSMSRSEELIQELESADFVVIATPMHNFTVPVALKACIDHVVRVRRTFNVTAEGKVGALRDGRPSPSTAPRTTASHVRRRAVSSRSSA